LTAQRPWWLDRDECEDAPPVVLDVVDLARVPGNDASSKTALAFSADLGYVDSATPEPWQARTSLPPEGGQMEAGSTPGSGTQPSRSGFTTQDVTRSPSPRGCP
jgi:hypothetical protein